MKSALQKFTLLPEEVASSVNGAVLTRLETKTEGLSWAEAVLRLEQHGPNVSVPQCVPPWYAVLWTAFQNPFNYVLLFLGVVSYLTDDVKAVLVMVVMVTVATLLRFWQELRSQVKAESLRQLVRNTATVLRSGAVPADRVPDSLDRNASEVLIEELVPGDIVRLSAGDMVPGDVRLLESRDLFVNQSSLTGEAMPVEKYAQPIKREAAPVTKHRASFIGLFDAPELCFMGSSVVSGTATAVVFATGPDTQMGALASKLVEARPPTAFDLGVNKVSWLLIKFMFVMVPVVFLLNGLVKGNWVDAFFFAVAVAVGLTPEMLPMIVNTNLARGAMAMSREQVVVKRVAAIQNFGAMDILCTDKTGTLTQDKVVLIKHLDALGNHSDTVLQHAYLNSLFQSGLKNLLDRAIIEHAHEAYGLRELAKSFTKIDELPFDFTRRRMSVVLKPSAGGPNLIYCKGAVDEMLHACTQVEKDGEAVPLDDAQRREIRRVRDDMNNEGLRLVGVAYRSVGKAAGEISNADESRLIFSGFVAFLDPPKETTKEALRLLRAHGLAVKIFTGDNALVAAKICRDVGLDASRVVLGAEVEAAEDEQLKMLAESGTLFAKLTPAQKARLVHALKANGHTVGFMGDGINDALALRAADVGISVDSGVDIAKEAADIILLEKSLLVLERGVIEGRRTFGNIVKYIKMAASSNFGNVLSVLVASAFLPFLPMLAIHLLIQNLLYDISQVSIPWDRMDEEWLKKPRKWEAVAIARFMVCVGPVSSIFDMTTFLAMWFVFGANTPARQSLFQSGWFVEGLLTQTLIVHMIRTENIPFLQSTASAPVLWLTTAIMLVGCYLPFSRLGAAVRLGHLPPNYWLFLASTLLCYCLLTQLVKMIYVRRFKDWL